MNISELQSYISEVPDYPKKGILFYDISTLINNSEAFMFSIEALASLLKKYDINKLAAIDARGFIFGAALAQKLGLGLVMIRKKNKLPGKTLTQSYDLEYGQDTLEIKSELSQAKFALVDDVLATGGTASAAIELIKKGGGTINCFCTLIELGFLSGRKKIQIPYETLMKY